jgi:hypothetical protein
MKVAARLQDADGINKATDNIMSRRDIEINNEHSVTLYILALFAHRTPQGSRQPISPEVSLMSPVLGNQPARHVFKAGSLRCDCWAAGDKGAREMLENELTRASTGKSIQLL